MAVQGGLGDTGVFGDVFDPGRVVPCSAKQRRAASAILDLWLWRGMSGPCAEASVETPGIGDAQCEPRDSALGPRPESIRCEVSV
jgi:hypothetical protein